MAMQLSKRGAGASAAHEACYLYAYPDPGSGGVPWTIGIGHTERAGLPKVRPGDRISFQRAWDIYATDAAKFEAGVNNAIRVPLKQHEFDALFSLHLNTGAVKTGTVDDKLNSGQREAALATWLQYNKAAGRVMNGLVTRRREEVELFRTGRYPSRQILLRETPTSTPRRINPDNIPWRGTTPATSVPVVPLPAAPAAPIASVEVDRPLPATPVKQPKPAAAPSDLWTAIGRWLAGGQMQWT
jgi:GH24 family phage-related lysozyme (muramidase)